MWHVEAKFCKLVSTGFFLMLKHSMPAFNFSPPFKCWNLEHKDVVLHFLK